MQRKTLKEIIQSINFEDETRKEKGEKAMTKEEIMVWLESELAKIEKNDEHLIKIWKKEQEYFQKQHDTVEKIINCECAFCKSVLGE